MKLKKRLKLSAMTVFLAMLLGFAVMSIGTEQAFAMEWNETDNRYEISNYADLKGFAQIVNSGNTGACAKLTADIECDDELWEPIGNLYNQYTGAFDGDGHTITALSNGECISNFQGLFGYIGSEGIVKNVGLEDISIRGSAFVGGVAGWNDGGTITNCYNTGDLGGTGNVGGVAGRNDGGTITNCYNTGSVSGSGHDVGGVAGVNQESGTIKNCYNAGDVSGTEGVGGVAGLNQESGTIENCYNTGAVSGNSYVGGVAGLNQVKGTITNCYNTGAVTGSDVFVGGVAGNNNEGTITNCYNTGAVSGSEHYVGGVAGNNDGTIGSCYNTGDVSGSRYYVGGVAGTNARTIENCYNTGAVSGTEYVGGVAGTGRGTITNCYNTGAVSGSGNSVGGVAGTGRGTITNCYYDAELCKDKKAIGTADDTDNVKGLTTDQMTGMGALSNMVFVYGTGETPPWMERANDTCVQYFPHLEGFLYDTTKDPDDWPASIQNHIWSTDWSKNGNNHWHECTVCHMKNDEANHTWDAGKETKKATEKATGVRTYTCTVCKATKTEAIPKLPPSAPGAGPGTLAKATAGKRSLTFRWDKVEGADGYDIFFSRCNSKGRKITLKNVRTIEGNKIFSWTKKGLKKRTAYKAYVKAFVMKDGKKTYIKTSPEMHAITGGYNRKYTNAKAVTVNKTEVTLTQGKSFKVKAKVKKLKKNKRLMPKSHAPKLRYMSSDSNVATVSKSGRITATGKGTCTIVAFAHNGVSKNIKVTVE